MLNIAVGKNVRTRYVHRVPCAKSMRKIGGTTIIRPVRKGQGLFIFKEEFFYV